MVWRCRYPHQRIQLTLVVTKMLSPTTLPILAAIALLLTLAAHAAPVSEYDSVVEQYCKKDAFHCIFMGSTAKDTTLDLKDASSSITHAVDPKDHITVFALRDGATGHLSSTCNGKQGSVWFTLDNQSGSSAELTQGGDDFNGIFKSRPGIRLAGGRISSKVPGDDLNVYCSLK